MEEGEYCWMWTKRKHFLRSIFLASPTPPIFNSFYDHESSWEEQAFAEDGPVNGGCIWPPASYTCSFCTREFKSAQALGGHMNVHRRDRARLKQPPIGPHNNIDDQNEIPFTSSLGSLLYYSNTTTATANPNSSDHLDALAASEAKLAPPVSSNLDEDHRLYSQRLDLRADHKRRRITTDASSTPFFTNSISVDNRDHHHHHIKSQMLEFISPSSIEELDLELRLGHTTPNN